jgi:hypothetical protein
MSQENWETVGMIAFILHALLWLPLAIVMGTMGFCELLVALCAALVLTVLATLVAVIHTRARAGATFAAIDLCVTSAMLLFSSIKTFGL